MERSLFPKQLSFLMDEQKNNNKMFDYKGYSSSLHHTMIVSRKIFFSIIKSIYFDLTFKTDCFL